MARPLVHQIELYGCEFRLFFRNCPYGKASALHNQKSPPPQKSKSQIALHKNLLLFWARGGKFKRMRIPIKEVEYIARLARLRLTEEEKEKYSIQLGKILEYVQQLNELDLEDVPPTSHVVPLKSVFRKDVVRESLPQGEALRNAPQKERGYFKVPKVLG